MKIANLMRIPNGFAAFGLSRDNCVFVFLGKCGLAMRISCYCHVNRLESTDNLDLFRSCCELFRF